MAKRPTITTITNGFFGKSAFNQNFESLRDQFDNTLSLDGSTPNAMGADFDMNSNDILNASTIYTDSLSVGGVNIVDARAVPDWQGVWTTATSYAKDDIVRNDGDVYICLVAHTSGTFATDLAAGKWELFTAKGNVAITTFKYTATASQTVFTGADANGVTLAYDVGNILVLLNGVALLDTTDYTATDGATVTLTTGATVSDILAIMAFSGGSAGSGSGTVTSVAATVPTGFTVSGTPITSSGTLAIAYDTGYQGYTTTEASKLSGIEAGADVTDTANVTAAGALMDSEVTNLAAVKAFAPTDYATAAQGTLADSALQSGDNISALTNDSGYTTNAGTVTSVAASVPVGFTVSGTPVTSSGTLAIAYDTGYQGYTTTEASKLSGIETGATADQTAGEILTALLTVDGTGSLLDADLLDGNEASAFATAGHNHTGVYEPADATILKDADIGVTVQKVITVSTTAPSSPSTGDLWVDTN